MPPKAKPFIDEFSEALKDKTIVESLVKSILPSLLSSITQDVLRLVNDDLDSKTNSVIVNSVELHKRIKFLEDENAYLKKCLSEKSEKSAETDRRNFYTVTSDSCALDGGNMFNRNDARTQDVMYSRTAGIASFDPVVQRYRGPPLIRPRPKPVVGTRNQEKIRGESRKVDIFLYRVTQSTEDHEIEQLFKNANIEYFDIDRVSNDNARMKSFRIKIQLKDYDTVCNPDFLPKDVMCRKFYTPRSCEPNTGKLRNADRDSQASNE